MKITSFMFFFILSVIFEDQFLKTFQMYFFQKTFDIFADPDLVLINKLSDMFLPKHFEIVEVDKVITVNPILFQWFYKQLLVNTILLVFCLSFVTVITIVKESVNKEPIKLLLKQTLVLLQYFK